SPPRRSSDLASARLRSSDTCDLDWSPPNPSNGDHLVRGVIDEQATQVRLLKDASQVAVTDLSRIEFDRHERDPRDLPEAEGRSVNRLRHSQRSGASDERLG